MSEEDVQVDFPRTFFLLTKIFTWDTPKKIYEESKNSLWCEWIFKWISQVEADSLEDHPFQHQVRLLFLHSDEKWRPKKWNEYDEGAGHFVQIN